MLIGDNSVDYWTATFKAAHVGSVEGILNLAKLMADCPDEIREECGHAAGYKSSSMSMFCSIHRNGYLRFSNTKSKLPASWYSLYELTLLSDEDWEGALAAGKITPELKQVEVPALRFSDRDEASPFVMLPPNIYETIVIDPPWPMDTIKRAVDNTQDTMAYPTMSVEDIARIQIDEIAHTDCHLFCWTTQKFLPSVLDVIRGWGFKYVLTMVWHKQGGFQPFGLPQYNCEFCVYARKGAPKFIDTKDFFVCFKAKRREHSRKPNEFYETLRRVTRGPRIDIFSREIKEGFESAGNETTKFETATVQ